MHFSCLIREASWASRQWLSVSLMWSPCRDHDTLISNRTSVFPRSRIIAEEGEEKYCRWIQENISIAEEGAKDATWWKNVVDGYKKMMLAAYSRAASGMNLQSLWQFEQNQPKLNLTKPQHKEGRWAWSPTLSQRVIGNWNLLGNEESFCFKNCSSW